MQQSDSVFLLVILLGGTESACIVGDLGPSLGREDPLEEGMATSPVFLPREVPWTEEPGSLQPMGSQRVGDDWATNTHTYSI